MALPKGDQYNEAVQNPQFSFSDADLRTSKVETDSWGLPKPYSGGFTVTFKLQNARDNWAVRCTIKDIPELTRRYQTITDFFSGHNSAYFIEAKLLQNGIRVNGSFYPVIKMKWMDGDPMNIYLSNYYKEKDKVESVLNDFLKMVKELEELGVAHGDLQQGNIIIKSGKIHLIDYDGMFLPALKGLPSNELGHPNFQHPERSAKDFNEKIDRFSAIVIYLSLKALIYKPSLWTKYHNSENLIIKSKDISDLAGSPVMADLNAIPEIRPLVERFAGVCHLDFDRIPSLKEFINGNFVYDKSKVGRIAVKTSLYEVLDGKMKASILEHYGERVEVVGYISACRQGRTIGGKPYYFLNMGRYPNQTFTITIWSEGINSLIAAGLSPDSLVTNWVSVTGVITSYGGSPQAVAEQASQIQILQNEQDARDKLQLKKTIVTPPPKPPANSTNAANQKRVIDKEAQVFGDLYKNIPASNKPSTNPTPRSTPVPKQTPSYGNPSHSPISSSRSRASSSNNGCLIPLVFASIGAIFIGAMTDGKYWFLGAIGGGIIGAWISSAVK